MLFSFNIYIVLLYFILKAGLLQVCEYQGFIQGRGVSGVYSM